jgi:decaprenylphospho-beta-D-ribofuranose 2-oxidase
MTKRVSGWGRSIHSFTHLLIARPLENLIEKRSERGVIARGLGRSYGDSAGNTGGITLELCHFDGIQIDTGSGIATLGSGITIQKLEEECLSLGYFPFVVPGTAKVTIGGAIASDIHGKSHHRVGSFSNHLIEMKILTSDGLERTLYPSGETSDLFWATVGGMGLTGIILEAKIRLHKVETSFVKVVEIRTENLDQLLTTLLDFNKRFLYTVAWVDLSGKFAGRGLVSGANHACVSDVSNRKLLKRTLPKLKNEFKIAFPFGFSIINNWTIKLFNSVWFNKPHGKKIQQIQKFMHPLDRIDNWNEVYGTNGFIQYQFVIPYEKSNLLEMVITKLRDAKCGSFLTVLKSFGENSNGFISFPIKGWTLAVDLPNSGQKLSKVLREIDEIVVSAGGRVYLTKDSRLNSGLLPDMYPNLEKWKSIKKEFDPLNHWQSDQGRRLNLC